jgi:hypothetical protein
MGDEYVEKKIRVYKDQVKGQSKLNKYVVGPAKKVIGIKDSKVSRMTA